MNLLKAVNGKILIGHCDGSINTLSPETLL